MLQKSGRLVLWEAMFILELHSAETQVFLCISICSSPGISSAANHIHKSICFTNGALTRGWSFYVRADVQKRVHYLKLLTLTLVR